VHTGEGILKKGLDGPCSKVRAMSPRHRPRRPLAHGEAVVCVQGKKQRTHEVKVERGRVLVKLDQSPDELASDHYAHMGACVCCG
jgi:hypothetical protein